MNPTDRPQNHSHIREYRLHMQSSLMNPSDRRQNHSHIRPVREGRIKVTELFYKIK